MSTHTIVTWNINGLRARLGQAEELLATCSFLCLQETKIAPDMIDLAPDYYVAASYCDTPGRAGVMTISKQPSSAVNIDPIGNGAFSGRSLLTDYGNFSILNLYVPHGGRDHSKLSEKAAFLSELHLFLSQYSGNPLIIAGDFNIARSSQDLARPHQNNTSIMTLVDLRTQLERILALNWTDAVRDQAPSQIGPFSWWPYAFNCRARDIGWRIDYILLPGAIQQLEAVHMTHYGTSDHCPVRVRFRLQEPPLES